MSEVGHYEYKAHFDQLVGVKIASVNVDADAGLALRIEFESGLHFQMAPCEQIYDDFERDCWALACGDGYVVLVGGRQGQWKRIRKSEPVYGPPPAEVDGKPNPHLKRRT